MTKWTRGIRRPRTWTRRGLSSYGYDIRVGDEFKVFTNINNTVIDPKPRTAPPQKNLVILQVLRAERAY